MSKSKCSIRVDSPLAQEVLDTPIECGRCDAKVPSSAALSLEGCDYLWQFCGHDSLAKWCETIEPKRR